MPGLHPAQLAVVRLQQLLAFRCALMSSLVLTKLFCNDRADSDVHVQLEMHRCTHAG